MRKASLVLGIISSIIALIATGVYTVVALFRDSLFPFYPFYGGENAFVRSFGSYPALMITTAVATGLATILGIIACVLLRKKNVTAGVLFFIASVPTILSSFLAALLFILSGIFALVKSRQSDMSAPYPPGWSPYMPYGAYPPPPAAPQFAPYGSPSAPLYPPYGMQVAPPPPLYNAYPPSAAPTPPANNIKEEP